MGAVRDYALGAACTLSGKAVAQADTRVWTDKKPFVDPTSGDPTSGRVAIAAAEI
jgi:hypothetical protein